MYFFNFLRVEVLRVIHFIFLGSPWSRISFQCNIFPLFGYFTLYTLTLLVWVKFVSFKPVYSSQWLAKLLWGISFLLTFYHFSCSWRLHNCLESFGQFFPEKGFPILPFHFSWITITALASICPGCNCFPE